MNNSIRASLRELEQEVAKKSEESVQIAETRDAIYIEAQIADCLVIENLLETFHRDFFDCGEILDDDDMTAALSSVSKVRRDLENQRQKKTDTEEQLLFDEHAAPDTELSEG